MASSMPATPAYVAFPSQNTRTTSAAQSVTITNNGCAPRTVSTVTSAAPFTAVDSAATPCANATQVPGDSSSVSVTFSPTAAGAATGSLVVTSDDPAGSLTVALSGTG